jgi:elongation factor Tu
VVRGSALAAHDHPTDPAATWCIAELLGALDASIPDPVRAIDLPLLMPIENVYSIEGRGTVVTGMIAQGILRAGDDVDIVGYATEPRTVRCTQVEMFHQLLDVAQAGDSPGCLLRNVEFDSVQRGQVLAAPGSIRPRAEFEAEVYVLSKNEGGRHTPFFTGYSPQFFFRTANVTGETHVLGEADMALPGDGVRLGVRLHKPVAIADGAHFAIREGNRTVGSGVVTRIVA